MTAPIAPSAPTSPTAPLGSSPTPPPGPTHIVPPEPGKAPDAKATIDPEDDPFSALKNYGEKPPEKAPEKPVEKKEGDKDAKPPEKNPEDKKPDEKKPEQKPEEKPPGRKTGWQMYHEEKKRVEELQTKVGDLNRQLSERAKAPQDFKIDDHPEFKSTKEKLTRYEKQLQELEDKIRFVDYESSEEYKQKFHAPYVEAWQHGKASIEQMKVLTAEGQQPRNGTIEDLQRIVSAPSAEDAAQIAEDLFGSSAKAAYALSLRDRIIQKHQDAIRARDEFKTKGAEQAKMSAAEQERQNAERAKVFNTVADEAVEKYPQWFKPEDGDERGNELLEIGFMLANAAFGGQIKDGKTGELRDPTPEEIPLIHAQMRNKAAGFDRLAYKNQKLQSRVNELEEMLDKYEKTEPPPGETGGKKVEGEEDPFARFEKK